VTPLALSSAEKSVSVQTLKNKHTNTVNDISTPCSSACVDKNRLKWKLKISNATDNADITQSQACDTKHRRMKDVNSLCTDSRPLWANTVLCHSTQYKLLVSSMSYFCYFLIFICLVLCKICKINN